MNTPIVHIDATSDDPSKEPLRVDAHTLRQLVGGAGRVGDLAGTGYPRPELQDELEAAYRDMDAVAADFRKALAKAAKATETPAGRKATKVLADATRRPAQKLGFDA